MRMLPPTPCGSQRVEHGGSVEYTTATTLGRLLADHTEAFSARVSRPMPPLVIFAFLSVIRAGGISGPKEEILAWPAGFPSQLRVQPIRFAPLTSAAKNWPLPTGELPRVPLIYTALSVRTQAFTGR